MITVLYVIAGFFAGLAVGEIIAAPVGEETYYVVNRQARVYRVQCAPGRFERLCERIEGQAEGTDNSTQRMEVI